MIKIGFGADVTLENLEVSGAKTGPNGTGHGIELAANNGATRIRVFRVLVTQNAAAGIAASGASIEAFETTFSSNDKGVQLVEVSGTFDRCVATGNRVGLSLDGGLYSVSNTFVVRNAQTGVEIFPSEAGGVIQFSTIVDNATGINCITNGTSTGTFPNNILARNGVNTVGTTCSFPGSLLLATDIAPLRFASPDIAPFDYHIVAGSSAIDAANDTTNDHDIDGQPRPTTGADVGADELQ